MANKALFDYVVKPGRWRQRFVIELIYACGSALDHTNINLGWVGVLD